VGQGAAVRITLDDGRVLDVPEANAMPGIGVEVYDVEGIATLYPWHRVSKLEREYTPASPLQAPGGPVILGGN
jgi:hypothetical protein